MRYDLKILWVEDSRVFYDSAKGILIMYAEDNGISLDFEYVEDVEVFIEKIEKETNRFKAYDICFVDYNLSQKILGNDLIKQLKRKELDSDILFYSSEYEPKIREDIREDLSSFEGVYIANRENFEEKANYLITKNARNLTKLSNIRGFLMDQTSENDYIIKSYILRKFAELSTEQKEEISKFVLQFIRESVKSFDTKANNLLEQLDDRGIGNIKNFMRNMNDVVPLKLKYQIFEKMITFLGEVSFEEVTLEKYFEDIVKARNNLAHKKLDLCKMQRYIKYYDDIDQFENRKCPKDCKEHTNDNKYSMDDWNEIRKNVQKFGRSIDAVQEKL